jgi:hypothetical protein
MPIDRNVVRQFINPPSVPEPQAYPESAKSYNPSLRDIIANVLMGSAPSPLRADMVGKMVGSKGAGNTQAVAPLDFVPGVGTAVGVNEGYREGDAQNMMLSMFGGASSKARNASAFNKAIDMLGEKRSATEIWQETKHFSGADGIVREHIPIHDSYTNDKIIHAMADSPGWEFPLSEVWSAPRFFEAYPEFKDFPVQGFTGGSAMGTSNGSNIGLNTRALLNDLPPTDKWSPNSIIAHEMGHEVANKERWSNAVGIMEKPGDTPRDVLLRYISQSNELEQNSIQNMLAAGKEAVDRKPPQAFEFIPKGYLPQIGHTTDLHIPRSKQTLGYNTWDKGVYRKIDDLAPVNNPKYGHRGLYGK